MKLPGDNKEWNLILNTVAWTLLMILNCTFSLSAKDVLKDAENSGKSCTKFHTQFFSVILHEQTDKKLDTNMTISTRL